MVRFKKNLKRSDINLKFANASGSVRNVIRQTPTGGISAGWELRPVLWVQTRTKQIQTDGVYWVMKTSIRILNLEDCAADAELNEAMISARWPNCEYVRVDNQADFTAALEKKNFDVILSDYTMPGFDGRSALALAHEKCPETPFLFVSGTIGEDVAIEALKSGATDYVLKHRLMRLIPALDRALREAAEHAERERAETGHVRESEHKYQRGI